MKCRTCWKPVPCALLLLATLAARSTAIAAAPPADPLPSWNEGAARQAIINFVTRVTTEGGKDFVPPKDRIATFDNDNASKARTPTP